MFHRWGAGGYLQVAGVGAHCVPVGIAFPCDPCQVGEVVPLNRSAVDGGGIGVVPESLGDLCLHVAGVVVLWCWEGAPPLDMDFRGVAVGGSDGDVEG